MLTVDEATVLAAARAALADAPATGSPRYPAFCRETARLLRGRWAELTAANAVDVAAATARGLPGPIVDRLRLRPAHLDQFDALAGAAAAGIPPAGDGPERRVGTMSVRRVSRPLGVVLFVYEARPTVTVEGALLAVASGNAVLLRGGTEIRATDRALAGILGAALAAAGLPGGLVTVLDDPDRRLLRDLLRRPDGVDLVVPRGGPSLVEHCRRTSAAPVLASGGGVNHLYVHRSADLDLAADIALDSKLAEPTACNTAELVLVDEQVAVGLVATLVGRDRDLTLRVPPALHRAGGALTRIDPLADYDLGREFLGPTLAVLAVDGLDAAVAHIRAYGSAHTEGVVAADPGVIAAFTARVDAAAVVVNGSLRLHDGPTMGVGPELSISTGRFHARGPVTMSALRTHSWVIDGRGTLRGEGS